MRWEYEGRDLSSLVIVHGSPERVDQSRAATPDPDIVSAPVGFASPIPEAEMQARRSLNHWMHWANQRWRPTFPVTTAEGWTIRQALRRREFARADPPRGNKGVMVHRVREQFTMTKPGRQMFVYTRFLCGGCTWHGRLLAESGEVCARCQAIFDGTASGVVRLSP